MEPGFHVPFSMAAQVQGTIDIGPFGSTPADVELPVYLVPLVGFGYTIDIPDIAHGPLSDSIIIDAPGIVHEPPTVGIDGIAAIELDIFDVAVIGPDHEGGLDVIESAGFVGRHPDIADAGMILGDIDPALTYETEVLHRDVGVADPDRAAEIAVPGGGAGREVVDRGSTCALAAKDGVGVGGDAVGVFLEDPQKGRRSPAFEGTFRQFNDTSRGSERGQSLIDRLLVVGSRTEVVCLRFGGRAAVMGGYVEGDSTCSLDKKTDYKECYEVCR